MSGPVADRRELRRLIIALCVLLIALAALAGYLLHVKRASDRRWQNRPRFPQMAAPPAPDQAEVTLILPNDESGEFASRKISMPVSADAGERLRAELRALLSQWQEPDSSHPVAPDANIISVFLLGNDAAVVNANAALMAGLAGRREIERLTVEGITRTIAANHPGIHRVKILIDGAEPEPGAGHLDLRGWFLSTGSNASPAR